jgi:hypothetical protein
MKPNYKHLSVLLLGALYIVGMLYFLYGCKEPQAIYKTEYKTIKDTLIVNGDTIIRNIEVKQDCPECVEKTRFETRLEYRLDKRKLKAIEDMYKDSLKEARKIVNYQTKWKTKEVIKLAKAENKSNWLTWLLVGFGIAQGLRLAWILIQKRL